MRAQVDPVEPADVASPTRLVGGGGITVDVTTAVVPHTPAAVLELVA